LIDWQGWIRDRRRWTAVVLTVALAGVGWIAASAAPASATTGGKIPAPRQGFLAPPIKLQTPAGETLSLADLRGNVVVLNFWASWCPPCRAEMPALDRAYRLDRQQGLMVLGVNGTFQDSAEQAVAFANAQGVSFPILLDREGTVSRQYLVGALPTTFFIDRSGTIRKVIVGGPMSEATLRSTVQALLQESP
jgi:cytochrome c biogenesis protein CcmG/thiol:disulfide interchange protein DsbE